MTAPIDEMKFQSLKAPRRSAIHRGMPCRIFRSITPDARNISAATTRKASGRVGTAHGTVRSSGRAAVQSWGRLDMSATGLDVFDKTLPTTNIWLDEIMGQAWARPTAGMYT
jgi:hypothetical protein